MCVMDGCRLIKPLSGYWASDDNINGFLLSCVSLQESLSECSSILNVMVFTNNMDVLQQLMDSKRRINGKLLSQDEEGTFSV